jgi:hypothetical protein
VAKRHAADVPGRRGERNRRRRLRGSPPRLGRAYSSPTSLRTSSGRETGPRSWQPLRKPISDSCGGLPLSSASSTRATVGWKPISPNDPVGGVTRDNRRRTIVEHLVSGPASQVGVGPSFSSYTREPVELERCRRAAAGVDVIAERIARAAECGADHNGCRGCTRRSLGFAAVRSFQPKPLQTEGFGEPERTGANARQPLPCRRSWVRVPSSALMACKRASLDVLPGNR